VFVSIGLTGRRTAALVRMTPDLYRKAGANRRLQFNAKSTAGHKFFEKAVLRRCPSSRPKKSPNPHVASAKHSRLIG